MRNQNWPIMACKLLLATYVIEFAVFCLIVPEKRVMDIALFATYAISTAIFLQLEWYDKKMQPEVTSGSASSILALLLIIGSVLLVGLELKCAQIKSAPYFAGRASLLHYLFIPITMQLDARMKAVKQTSN